jgi:flagellar motor protein MotB
VFKKSLILAALISSSVFAEGTFENIYFFNADLRTGINYSNVRYSGGGKKVFYMGESFNKKSMTYIKPDNYTWEEKTLNGKMNDMLVFNNTSNFAWLKQIKIGANEEVYLEKIEGSQNEYVTELSGNTCSGDGCRLDENIISGVIPKRYKILTYTAYEVDEKGNYKFIKNANVKQIGNTITLYTKNAPGASIILTIKDRSSASTIYDNVSKSMAKYSDVKVVSKENETKIIMPMDNVFDSGSAIAKPIGKEWLATLVNSLKGKAFKEIRVEGHTDNTPIKSTMFPSNWELSTARASDTVRYMIEKGIPETKVVAMGYSDTKPVAKNDSAQNKAKNRRIEITVVGSLSK